MRTLFRSFRNRHGFVASCFLFTLLATLFLPITASAGDQENSTGKSADREGLPPTRSLPKRRLTSEHSAMDCLSRGYRLGPYRRRQSNARRTSAGHRTILRLRQPPPASKLSTATSSTRVFRRTENKPNLPWRFRLRRGVVVFQHLQPERHQSHRPRQSGRLAGDEGSRHFWQTQDFPYQAMAWKSTTNLYSAEANGRLDLSSRVTVLAGFRWLQLNDNLQGTLTPADLTAPTWKQTCCSVVQLQYFPDHAGWTSRKLPPLLEYAARRTTFMASKSAWMQKCWSLAAFRSAD